jgi:hypothetical protein
MGIPPESESFSNPVDCVQSIPQKNKSQAEKHHSFMGGGSSPATKRVPADV